MSKIIALYINEMSKMLRKVSTIVILALIVAACIAIPIFLKFATPLFSDSYWMGTMDLQYQKEHLEDASEAIENDLRALNDSEESEISRSELLRNKQETELSLERIDLLIEAGYETDERADFIYDAINKIRDLRSNVLMIETMPSELRTQSDEEYLAFFHDCIEQIHTLVRTNDFRGYIDMLHDTLEYADPGPGIYNLATERELNSLEMIYRADPSGGTDGTYNYAAALEAAGMIYAWKDELEQGYSVTYSMYSYNGEEAEALSPEKRDQLENSIAVLEYRIKTDSYPSGMNMTIAALAKEFCASVGQFLVAVLVLMAAGGSIAQEIATGSIKSLIIAPVRRWKIFTAKLLSLLTLLTGSLLILSVLSTLSTLVFFGGDSLVNYAYAHDGTVGTIPYVINDVLVSFVASVDILVFLVFALMLSTILRNTALAVGLSVGTYLITGSVSGIFAQLPIARQLWMDFIPFSNFDLKTDVFPFLLYSVPVDYSEMFMMNMDTQRPGLLFSCIYLLVIVFCMLLTSYDSFSRRDIK